jgi:Asp-tRNA(Asn)/Glu-tRNA(Gln) amidotransferase C subunit
MKDIFDFEKFATIDVVDIHLEKRVIKLMEKANEQKASQTREPTLSIEETRERLRKKMVDSSGEEAKFGV